MSTSKSKRLDLAPLVVKKFTEARARPGGYDDLVIAQELLDEHPKEIGEFSLLLALERLRDWFGELARSASYSEGTLLLPGIGDIPAVITFEVREVIKLVGSDDDEEEAVRVRVRKRRIGLEFANLGQLKSYRDLLEAQRLGIVANENVIIRMIDVATVRGCKDGQKVIDFLLPKEAVAE